MQSFMEILHFCLNKNPKKNKIDDTCDINLQIGQKQQIKNQSDKCFIHKNFHLKLKSESYCKCDSKKKFEQRFDNNYFTHLINAQEIIDEMKSFYEGSQEENLSKTVGSIQSINKGHNCMPQIWKKKNSGE